MYKLRRLSKHLRWRLIAKLIWWQSEAMRCDYLSTRDSAWAEGYGFPAFDLWLSYRVFGDEGGYRSSAVERNRLAAALENIRQIEAEDFSNHAGHLYAFLPWIQIKAMFQPWTPAPGGD
jgi:hypothetical protein